MTSMDITFRKKKFAAGRRRRSSQALFAYLPGIFEESGPCRPHPHQRLVPLALYTWKTQINNIRK